MVEFSARLQRMITQLYKQMATDKKLKVVEINKKRSLSRLKPTSTTARLIMEAVNRSRHSYIYLSYVIY